MDIYIIILFSFILVINIVILFMLFRKNNNNVNSNIDKDELNKSLKDNNQDIYNRLEINNKHLLDSFDSLNKSFSNLNELVTKKIDNIREDMNKSLVSMMEKNSNSNDENRKLLNDNLKEINNTLGNAIKELNDNLNKSLKEIREDNNKKLDDINNVVSEKLDKTLQDRLKVSFNSVIEQISGVTKSIGEIKGIAGEVTSLKSILTNVKNKGTMGEVILGQIIKDSLAPNQYEENVVTKKGAASRVEYAIKLPGVDDGYIYLPIDSKLPLNNYYKIKDGIEAGDTDIIKEGRKQLKDQLKTYSRDIADKYLDVPNTTDFGILFLPIEGLYIEALEMNLFEELKNDYKICLAGPTTLTAILNSLQLGFKTLAIQKKSADVFKLLGCVKTEFERFGDILTKAQKKMSEASKNIDDLVGVRTRQIQSKLKNIEALDLDEAEEILDN